MSDLVPLPNVPTREQIESLQREMSRYSQAELTTRHYFADGMYCRELFRPAGTVIVGKVHKKEHLFVLAQGEMTIWTEGGMKRVSAPLVMVSKPGTKRCTFAHTDATAITIHRVSSQDLAEIEAELVEDDPTAMFGPGNVPKRIESEVEACPSLPQP